MIMWGYLNFVEIGHFVSFGGCDMQIDYLLHTAIELRLQMVTE